MLVLGCSACTTVLTMAYAIGHLSGCHLNPAVTVGLACGGRFPLGLVLPYILAQVVGAIVGLAVLYAIASGSPDFNLLRICSKWLRRSFTRQIRARRMLSGGSGADDDVPLCHHGATHGKAPVGFAPVAIGLALTLIHLISIPVTNTSVNPARSTGPALFVGGWALAQLWLFGGAVNRWCGRWHHLSLAEQRAGGRNNRLGTPTRYR